MTDGGGTTAVERARGAASTGAVARGLRPLHRARTPTGCSASPTCRCSGEVAYAAGHLDVTIEAWERAYAECTQAGDELCGGGRGRARGDAPAVRHRAHGTRAGVAGTSRAAARRTTDGDARARVVRGGPQLRADADRATRRARASWARRAIEVGSVCDPAACAIGRVAEARLLILDGDVQQGLALLDEAGVAAVSGDLDPLSTGVVYCELVCALQGLAQYDLAEEWTEAMERWCETNAIGSLHGRCRVHRAEILRLRGACHEAEDQALLACEELRPYLRRELGWPLTELGRIRLRKGDLAGAEEALLAAHRAGWDPQPVLALVRLAQGDVGRRGRLHTGCARAPVAGAVEGAAAEHRAAAGAAARGAGRDRASRSGDIDRARSAADELELIAARFESKALVAGAALARGRVRLAEGDAAGAEQSCPTRCGSGTTSARRTRRRSPASASPMPTAPAAASSGRSWSATPRAPILDGIEAAGASGPSARRGRRAVHARRQRVPSRGRLLVGGVRRPHGADPRPQGDALPRPSARRSRPRAPRARPRRGREPGDGRTRATSAMPARCSTTAPRRPTADGSPRSTRTSRRRRRAGDAEREAQADAERDFLVRELSRAVGLGGRGRRAGSASERARAGVTRAVRQAMARIGEQHPQLGEHLERTIRTGTYCAYLPDPRTPTRWDV